jgi:hypothetical protein
MDITKDGGFKVGNTTLQTPLKIRITDYGYELPEINASTPLSMPIYAKAAFIINWLERGINVEFADIKSEERLFFFITEYNRFANEENKKIDNVENHYKLALNAQERLYKELDFKHVLKIKKEIQSSPFEMKLYKGIPKTSPNRVDKDIKKDSLKKSKSSKNIKAVYKDRPVGPGDSHAFDIFSQNPETLLIEKDAFPDIVFND